MLVLKHLRHQRLPESGWRVIIEPLSGRVDLFGDPVEIGTEDPLFRRQVAEALSLPESEVRLAPKYRLKSGQTAYIYDHDSDRWFLVKVETLVQ